LSVARLFALAPVLALAGVACAACGPKVAPGPPVGTSDKPGDTVVTDRPVAYVFDSLDDRPVSSDAMLGKPTVIAFITTGDLVGQAQVDFLVAMAKTDAGKVNYALVALHPRREMVLVDTYVQTLKVEFPVALADAAATTTSGPFGEIPAVPTVIVLDRAGRIAWKHTGLAKSEELRAHMRGL
jgi:hypothetical protein